MTKQTLPAVQTAHELDCVSHSATQTERLGQRIGERLQAGDLLLLVGEFGAGKTHLVKGIARGLDSSDMVTSPSFVLVNEYQAGPRLGGMPIYHVDLYRLGAESELATIGLDELWQGDGVCLIEWPELAAAHVPAEHLAIHIRHLSETKRTLRLVPQGSRYIELVAAVKMAFGS
jgi:tRNA threonylcarbamoyladenosine biosynthesis protein TsaE